MLQNKPRTGRAHLSSSSIMSHGFQVKFWCRHQDSILLTNFEFLFELTHHKKKKKRNQKLFKYPFEWIIATFLLHSFLWFLCLKHFSGSIQSESVLSIIFFMQLHLFIISCFKIPVVRKQSTCISFLDEVFWIHPS